jgi:pimeloyl-[acyl-carrier protein] methyl ester esterase
VGIEGAGADLVMLHGWGMNGAAWRTLPTELAQHFRVHLVDLPGHGFSKDSEFSADGAALAETLLAHLPERAHWLGWSLGGTCALQVALNAAQRVDKLVLIGATPRFVAAASWPQGMGPAVFAEFRHGLQRDATTTLRQFLALQTLGVAGGTRLAKQLAAACNTRPQPSEATLRAGLELLHNAALEHRLGQIQHATLVIQGTLDRLVARQAGQRLAAALPRAELLEIADTGHAPFLTHSTALCQRIKEFLG